MYVNINITVIPLQWRHNGHDGVSNHRPHDCLLNRLFRRRSKKTSKLRVTFPCGGNSPVTDEFPAQRASNVENVSIWWRHHDQVEGIKSSLAYINLYGFLEFPIVVSICYEAMVMGCLAKWGLTTYGFLKGISFNENISVLIQTIVIVHFVSKDTIDHYPPLVWAMPWCH